MERQLIGAATVSEATTTEDESWEMRAETCLREVWHFLNRKVIDLHRAGRLSEAAELSEVREQVHSLLRERPLPAQSSPQTHNLHHPLSQLAEGSGLPASDDPSQFMPSTP